MKLRLPVLLLFALLAPQASAIDVDTLEKSVVRIIVKGRISVSTGTGAIVARGIVLTNEHVVRGGRHIEIRSQHIGATPEVKILWQSKALDLAILRADGLNLPSVELATKKPRKTDKVWAFGYPGVSDLDGFAQEATVTEGTVSQFQNRWQRGGTELEIIQHTAEINPGNSGGPLFDECGRVVGINTAGYTGDVAQGTFFASRITEAIPHLEQQGIQLQKRHDACAPSGGEHVVGLEQAIQKAQQDATAAKQEASAARQAVVTSGWVSLIMWLIVVAFLVAIVLALRMPRQQIVQARQQIVQVGKRAVRTSREYVSSRIAPGPRKPAGADGGNERAALVLAGFDTSGKKLRIPVPKHGAAATQGGYVIGRHAALVDHVVEGKHISRRHARITVEHGQCRIEDLNSTNGTQVNGRRLEAFAPTPIAPGDRVLLGTVEVQASDGG